MTFEEFWDVYDIKRPLPEGFEWREVSVGVLHVFGPNDVDYSIMPERLKGKRHGKST